MSWWYYEKSQIYHRLVFYSFLDESSIFSAFDDGDEELA